MNYVWYFALLAQLDRAPDFYVVETSGRRGFEPRAGLQPTRAPVPGKFAECLITDGIRDKPRSRSERFVRGHQEHQGLLEFHLVKFSPPVRNNWVLFSPPFHHLFTAIS